MESRVRDGKLPPLYDARASNRTLYTLKASQSKERAEEQGKTEDTKETMMNELAKKR
jgi:hypothetical protein